MCDNSIHNNKRDDIVKRLLLLKLHRWLGLFAATWLLTLGLTGIFLDHDEWRWLRQTEVPENWLSKSMMRYLPATVMRYVVVDDANADRWIGGSERGLWITENRGQQWSRLSFPDQSRPQVMRFAKIRDGDNRIIVIATDDGLWRMDGFAGPLERLAMRGRFINMVSPGSVPGEIVGVDDFETIFRMSIDAPNDYETVDLSQTTVHGLPQQVTMYRFLFDLHFGYGLFSRKVSTFINDFGGVALILLSLTGVLSWFLKRRWRRLPERAPSGDTRRIVNLSLYRLHAPTIGLLGIVPIVYLAITGILFNHIMMFIEWGEQIDVDRERLPYVWQYDSLKGEIDQVVTYPDQPEKLSISTRYGILNSGDGGKTWFANATTGAERGQLLRSDDHLFYSTNSRQFFTKPDYSDAWLAMEGVPSIVYDAEFSPEGLMVKNSRGFFLGDGDYIFEQSDIRHPDLNAGTLYLFMIDIHTGNVFHPEFRWVSDVITVMGIVMVISGPILWWRRRW